MCAACSSEEPTNAPPVVAVYITSLRKKLLAQARCQFHAGPLPGKSELDEAKDGNERIGLGLSD